MSQDPRKLRIIYMGTPEFAVPALMALIESRHQVVGVVTNPDKPAGRGNKLQYSPVKAAALAADIEVFQPKSLRKPESLEKLRQWAPDLIVVAAYGKILPPSILELPELGCLNIHASILPKYRGAAPINWAIVRGESVSGVTIMQMEEGLDTGPSLLEARVEITAEDTAQSLHDKLAPLGGPLLLQTIDGLLDGSVKPKPQAHEAATWAPMLSRESGLIDWSKSAKEIADMIRGFYPWPGAFAYWQPSSGPTQLIKFHSAKVAQGIELVADAQPGQILDATASKAQLLIACGQGVLACETLQAPGRRALGIRDLLNGMNMTPGERFVSAPSQE